MGAGGVASGWARYAGAAASALFVAGMVLAPGAGVQAREGPAVRGREAPGWPGREPHGDPAAKAGVGTAVGPGPGAACPVWFTLARGGLSEVFYPRLDHPCVRHLALAVGDGRSSALDERADADHRIEPVAEGVPAYRIISEFKNLKHKIEKTVFAHPRRPCILQRVRFTPREGPPSGDRLYALMDPHLGLRRGDGIGSTGRVGDFKGRRMLFAERDGEAVALACSAPWAAASAGFVGVSDAWSDLERNGRMTWAFERAGRGNVLLAGEVDLHDGDGTFVLSLGLGPTPDEAAQHALAGILDDFDGLLAEYVRGWRAWQRGLLPLDAPGAGGRDLYRVSAAVLRTHEAKVVPGGAIASLSTPWGQARDDRRNGPGRGGYHLVWPRDLAMIAGGLLAAGARDEARGVLDFLRATQEADGHWPQNLWVGGAAYWEGIQVGETALPILLLDLLRREGALRDGDLPRYWPMARAAAGYLVRRGPSSQEDRWEDERGFTPFTLAASVAALLAAAEMADGQGEPATARFLRETADAWNASIEEWTYVEGTDLARRVGVPGYYLRVAPPDDRGEPSRDRGHLQLRYRGRADRQVPPAAIVSPDALAYVRFGLRAPDDPRIRDTIRVIDATLKVETPSGPCWHRYTLDGYGEKPDGSPFDEQQGVGRAWPLLTGERAHYELAAGRRDEAARLLRTMAGFASDGGGLLPEQVWDTDDLPERGLYLGRPTGSAMPLAWAHAEYVKLLRSLRDGRVFDLPPQTSRRYLVEQVGSPRVIWRPDHRRRHLPAGKVLRVEFPGPAAVRWRVDDGPETEEPGLDSSLGLHYADLPTGPLTAGRTIHLTLVPSEEGTPGELDRSDLGPWEVAVK